MKKTVAYWQTVGFIFTAVVGTALHFLFDWTGGSAVAALFSAVNESIWEHIKLMFYPMILFAVAESRFWGRQIESFWCVKVAGILLGIVLIPAIYYTYTGVLGVKVDWFNVTIFFLVAGLVFWLETKWFQRGFSCPGNGRWAPVVLAMIVAAFTVLTFVPVRIPLFQDSVTGTYGFWQGT